MESPSGTFNALTKRTDKERKTGMKMKFSLLVLPMLFGWLSVQAADWPWFGGPARDGISSETGLRTAWGDDEPKRLWKAEAGEGYSSVVVGEGLAFSMGNANGKNTVFCWDAATGAKKWTHSFPCGKDPKYFNGGSRATPALAGGVLYLNSHEGAFFALEAKTGKVLWSKHLVDDFGGRRPGWGYSGSPLLVDGKVIVDTGAEDGALLAMDAKTGVKLWSSGGDEAGYASIMLRPERAGEALVFNRFGLCGFRLSDGKELFRYQHKTRYGINAAQPVDFGDSVLVSSAYGKGSALVSLGGRTPKTVWESESPACQMASLVRVGELAYGIHGQTGGRAKYATLFCLDVRKGRLRWEEKGLGVGSLILVGKTLVVLSDSGELVLVEPNPYEFKQSARFQVLGGKDGWTPPSYANGRLYCRSSKGSVVCLAMGVGK